MLSILLNAALNSSDGPLALCPPCHEEEPFTVAGFLLSLFKSAVSLLVIVFPLYKTFKAWESNRLQACRAMLAYWSAMTLLNAMKDVTDEVVGNWISTSLHHLIVAAIKLAPLALGPDRIYDMTVRPFFEHHEQEMDGLIKAGADRAAHYKQELMEVAQPTLEHVKETLHDTVETVKSSVGMKSDDAAETDGVPAVLSAEEAVRKDDELTVVKDASSLTGLRQRSKAAGGNAGGSEISQQEEAEIERAKRQNVLVEKIIWGHGLSAKNDEWQRQQREREAGGAQPAATQSTLSELEAAAANAQQSAAPAGVTATSASTTTTASVSSSSFSSSSAFAAGSAPVTVSAPVMPSASLSVNPTVAPRAVSPAAQAALDSLRTKQQQQQPSTATAGKVQLLDSRSIPSVVQSFSADQQKEL